jgi:prepilin signal peptidase PulO-like enzyme (type II secretory pathway)
MRYRWKYIVLLNARRLFGAASVPTFGRMTYIMHCHANTRYTPGLGSLVYYIVLLLNFVAFDYNLCPVLLMLCLTLSIA